MEVVAPAPVPAPILWSETRRRMAADRARVLDALATMPGQRPWLLIVHPCYLCLWLHRLAHHFHTRRAFLRSRFCWHLGLMLTGADISPMADLGGGLFISHPSGIGLIGRLGERCTLHAQSGAGGGSGLTTDIGAGPGLPVLGDDVVLEPGALVFGPVKIGNRVHVGVRCTVTKSLPDGSVVIPLEPRVLVQDDPVRA